MTGLQVVLCGLGGQGIVFATKVLAHAAGLAGREVICSEIKGMAQRRASVVSFLKIGDFAGPSIRRGAADVVLCLDPSELATAASFVRPDGVCVVPQGVESHPVFLDAGRGGVRMRTVQKGAARSSNMAMVGASGILDPETLRRAVQALSSETSRAENLDAFDRGCRIAGSEHET